MNNGDRVRNNHDGRSGIVLKIEGDLVFIRFTRVTPDHFIHSEEWIHKTALTII